MRLKRSLSTTKQTTWSNHGSTALSRLNSPTTKPPNLMPFCRMWCVPEWLATHTLNRCRLQEQLRKYVLLNYMAVVKITKKHNKNFPADVLDPLKQLAGHQFYISTALARVMKSCDRLQTKLKGSGINPFARSWVFDQDGPREGARLFTSLK